MALSELYTQSSVSIGATEYSLTNNSTSIATQTTDAFVCLYIESTDMAAGDEFEIALREKVTSGGTQRRIIIANLVGTQLEPYVTPSFLVLHGWDVTVKKIAGTDRTFSWSIRAVS
jgi:hypothetical protein